MSIAHKKSLMILYADKIDISSQQIMLILAEKGILYEVNWISQSNINIIKDLNPYSTLPILVDRDLVIYEVSIIMEYLDERCPHPPLMPVYPIARASNRLIMYRMAKDWYGLAMEGLILDNEQGKKAKAVSKLISGLESIIQVFETFDYFMSEEFSLLDCYLAPIIWKLYINNKLPKDHHFEALYNYSIKVFNRSSFQSLLTDEEKNYLSSNSLL